MNYRQILICFVTFLLIGGWPTAHAQKLKNVSPTKYETRAPAKNFSFHSEESLAEWGGEHFPEDIHLITYRSDDKTDLLYGLLDKRAKKPKWMLQPHYEWVYNFGSKSLSVKKKQTNDDTYCILNLDHGDCRQTDFSFTAKLKYRDFQSIPNWVGLDTLYTPTDRNHIVDVQLFTPDDRPLTIVRGVLRGLMADAPGAGDYRIKAYQIGDELSFRAVNDEGDIRDTLLKMEDNGLISVRHVDPHAIIEFGDMDNPQHGARKAYSPEELEKKGLEVMNMTNIELGLVWPRYEGENGDEPRPEDLLGLMPLHFDYEAGQIFARYFGDKEVALHACCIRPLGWLVVWDEPGGVKYALLQQSSTPEFDAVIASRVNAHYTDIERLWSPSADNGINKQSARRRGELVGRYALHMDDGSVEIYSGKIYGPVSGQVMALDASVDAANYPSWHQAEMRKTVAKQSDLEAARKAREEQRKAAREARDRALSEQRLRLKRQREAAAAEKQAQRQAAAAARAASQPKGLTEKIYGEWVSARMGYCNSNTLQTDLYAKASAKKACKDKGGSPLMTYVIESGYDPYKPYAEQCYQAQAVSECLFD